MIRKQYIDTTFGQIHVRMAGQPTDCPIVLLHQTASSSVMFEQVMRLLCDDYWVIAPDTPGFGGSFRPNQAPSTFLYADTLRQALWNLGVKQCWLFGHHTGAAIAVQVAHDWPSMVRKLCLCGPPLMTDAQVAYFEQTLIPFKPNNDYAQAVWQRTASKAAQVDPVLLYREAVLTMQADVQLHHAYRAVFEQDFAGQIGRITGPTFVFAGENDSLIQSVAPTFALLQDGTMRIVPDEGTFICDEQPQLVANILQTYFSG